MPTIEEIEHACSENNIKLIRLLWADNGGVVRGRVVNAENISNVAERGASWPMGVQRLTALEQTAHEVPVGSSDECVLIPDPDTFRILPYASQAAVMLCDAYDFYGDPWELDPRSTLKLFLDELSNDGLSVKSSFESEFYLYKQTNEGIEPFDDLPDHSADGMQNAHDLILEMVNSIEAQDMEFSVYYPELGPGQQEIVIKHSDGVSAADNKILQEQTIKGIARNHGLRASFIPKPYQDVPGSGCHIHISIWKNSKNIFSADDADSPYGLSEVGKQFIGGVLEHARALMAVTTPHIISYRRIREGTFSSAYSCWGEGNREAMVRVPASFWVDRGDSTRIEYKPADGTANPYLALLSILAAGMDGVERELDPGNPVNSNPRKISQSERDTRGIHRLPKSLGEALDALETDEVLAEAMGDNLHDAYISLKRKQWENFSGAGEVTEWEVDQFLRPF